ncbi:unnamed protein product [Parajaminaea phylloscopi]
MSRKRRHDGDDDGEDVSEAEASPALKRIRQSQEASQRYSGPSVPGSRGSSPSGSGLDGDFDASDASPSLVKEEETYGMDDSGDEESSGSHDELDGQQSDSKGEADEQRSRYTNSVPVPVAQSGVISRVELINFMCHKRLVMTLGPRTNFIIGHNGSGKSAILTGILVALGGKAATTNRGSSLKSLVKEGSDRAVVILHIKNKGSEAFRRQDFGDVVIIEKTINADGGGSWRMKAQNGHTVCNRKEDLNAFCDHTNIQVDNPMNVLTQDAARQFLSSSNPSELYDFFLRGTQLRQLSDEYGIIDSNIERMRRIVDNREDALPDLERETQLALNRYQLMQKQKDHRVRLQDLKNHIVWAQVVEHRRDFEDAAGVAERSRVKRDKLEREIERLASALEEHNNTITEIESRSRNDGDRTAPLTEERAKLKAELRELRIELNKVKDDEADQSAQYGRISRQTDDLSKRIEQETNKLAEGNRQRHMQLEARHGELEAERRGFAGQEATHREALREAIPRSEELSQREARLTEERNTVRNRVDEQEFLCRRLREASRNSVAAYGDRVPALIKAIEAEKTWRKKPVGPIGMHIKLKDSKWAPVLESVISNTLNAFCVTNHHDRKLLERLKRDLKCGAVPIVTGSDEPFDFSHGEPPAEVLTVLRVIDVDDSFVLHQLVNGVHIESSAIVERRSDGDRLMRSNFRNVRACYSQDMYSIRGGTVGSSSSTLTKYTGPPRLSTDVSGRLKEAMAQVAEDREILQRLDEQIKKVQRERGELQNSQKQSRDRLQIAQQRQTRIRNELAQIEEDMRADEPANIAALEEARKETREELEKVRQSFATVQTRKEAVELRIQPKQDRYDELRRLIEAAGDETGAIRHELQKAVEKRVQCAQDLKVRKTSHEKISDALSDQEDAMQQKKELFESAEQSALEYTDGVRLEATRSHAEYEREVEAVEKMLAEARRADGGTLEQVIAEYRSRQRAYDEAQEEVAEMKAVIKIMASALKKRLSKWQEHRQHIALRAKGNFTYHLNQRGYKGSLFFDHDDQKLVVKIQTDDPALTRGDASRNKDPRALSGGEKSFSTICLLLSLWEAIGCPIRCLDEFDVFMDAVNRRIAMRMITETAKTSHNVQYILITPQNMSNVKFDDGVQILRLSDPERGQGG